MSKRKKCTNGCLMIRAIHIIIAMVMLLILPGMAWLFDDETSRESLQGIKGVRVVVESIKPEIEKDGLTITQIQTDVELKLRLAGLNVLLYKELSKAPESPTLYVYPHVIKSSYNIYIYNIELALFQNVYLERDSKISTTAPTWSAGYLGITSELDYIRSKIKDKVDSFINAYLSVNPKK